MVKLLPVSLLALLFACLAVAAPSSPNDPFHDIAVQVHKAEDPVCCLQPLEPVEPVIDDDILLSFEEWKAKHFIDGRNHAATPHSSADTRLKSGGAASATSRGLDDLNCSTATQSGSSASPAVQLDDVALPDERAAPHFRIPLTDRFNHASLDCSARVHTAHKSAKSASSILSDKKDRYMLGPCDEQKQFVVVELCDDIRIDTVQLANYEFFSGVFKDFSVSVAKTYTTDPAGWTFAGTYRARNVRGIQSFHTPPTLRDFYRFIRIDIHSHYGSEYYCPISLLRVYGLTHLEEWKWDMWEAESRAKRSLEEVIPVGVAADSSQAVHIPTSNGSGVQEVRDEKPSRTPPLPQTTVAMLGSPESLPKGQATSAQGVLTTKPTEYSQESSSQPSPVDQSSASSSTDFSEGEALGEADDSAITTSHDQPTTSPEQVSTLSSNTSDSSMYDSHSEPSSSHINTLSSSQSRQTRNISLDSPKASGDSSPPSPPHLPPLPPSSVTVTLSAHPAPPPPPLMPSGGESIYRTIMNRLMMLEGNTTLYARYVEEQTAYTREMLRRLTEDVGRLEGLGKAQAQAYQRSVRDFERDRRRIESEYVELLAKVNYLTDEVVLEKRLGIAQLCLLLAVLVFLSLTRGSRGEPIHPRLAMRELGRRTLSISNSWVDRLTNRSTTPPPPARQRPKSAATDAATAPSRLSPTKSLLPFPIPPSSSISSIRKSTRPRTPTSTRLSILRHQVIHSHSTFASPSSPRPLMHRSASGHGFDGLTAAPRSMKRFARSAHLHEVKSTTGVSHRRLEKARENLAPPTRRGLSSSAMKEVELSEDVFGIGCGAPTLTPGKQKGERGDDRRPLSPLHLPSGQVPLSGYSIPEQMAEHPQGDEWEDTDTTGSDFE